MFIFIWNKWMRMLIRSENSRKGYGKIIRWYCSKQCSNDDKEAGILQKKDKERKEDYKRIKGRDLSFEWSFPAFYRLAVRLNINVDALMLIYYRLLREKLPENKESFENNIEELCGWRGWGVSWLLLVNYWRQMSRF